MKKILGISLSGIFFSFFIIVLCLCMLLASASVEDESNNESNGIDTLELFINAAQKELLLNGGKSGGDKYRIWYTGNADGANWCATFVSYCANQAGILNTAIPKFQSCDVGVEWFLEKNEFFYTEEYGGKEYNPSIGNLIFFCKGNKNDSTHVGIVVGVENTTITTIEGNSSNTVAMRTYDLSNPKKTILGFASPAFPSKVSYITSGSLSDAFKFFAKNESGANYDKGFSKGDGYHALGYYQFDNRYDLQEFLQYCYDDNPTLYSVFKPFLNVKKSTLANNSKLESAWQTAYANDPDDFANKQDQFEYNNYYLPVEEKLAKKGINISDRHDALKGMCCSLSNWAGSGTAVKIITDSGISNSMNDRDFISKVYDYLYSLKYEDYAQYGKTGKKYYNGWHNRWAREKEECLAFL